MRTHLNRSAFPGLFGFGKIKRGHIQWILALVVLFQVQLAAYSQCTTPITNISSTSASCPASGQIVVNSSADYEPSATYQIISGPASGGYPTSSQSSNSFAGLPAGIYDIQISCGTYTATVTDTIDNQYIPVTLATAVTEVCHAGGGGGNNREMAVANAGGKITAYVTAGNGAPFEYAFLQSSNLAEPDSNFYYSPNPIFGASSLGTYQVRVKDACGNIVKQLVELRSIYPAAQLNLQSLAYGCNEITATGNLTRVSDGTPINPDNSYYQVSMWYLSATDSCSIPGAGPNVDRYIFSASDLNFSFPDTVHRVLIRTLSYCGEEHLECVDLPQAQLVSNGNVHVGCSPADNVNLALGISGGTAPYKVTVQGYDAANTAVTGPPQTFTYDAATAFSIAPAHHYIYSVLDSCGRTLTDTVYSPLPTDAAQVVSLSTTTDCVDETGKANVTVIISGYVPNQDSTTITLVDATTGALVANASSYQSSTGAITFDNVAPGDYKVVFTPTNTSCTPTEVLLTIPDSTETLVFALNGTVSQTCGAVASITADLDYNGNRSITYELYMGSSFVESNTSGTFTNLAPGTYTLTAVADTTSCPGTPIGPLTKVLTVDPDSVNCNPNSGLGNYVWVDSNMNGLQDASEVGVAGVIATLFAADGITVIARDTTDASGFYNFLNLTAGGYIVGFSKLPSGYTFTTTGGNLNDAGNSDADGSGKTGLITLANNEFNPNIDAGIKNSLPVTLISFTAKEVEKAVLLSWSTSMETNSDRFEIENSFDGKSWEKIGTVFASKESNSIRAYHYIHNNPTPGIDLYRLRMIDADLSFTYSRIQQVNMGTENKSAVMFPNPVTERLFLNPDLIPTVHEVTITATNGRVVYTANAFPTEGLEVKKLSDGIYLVHIKQKDGGERSFRVLVVRQ